MFFKFIKKNKGAIISKEKRYTENIVIEDMKAPAFIVLPMNMHIGKEAEIVAKEGQLVKIGTLIGKKSAFISANIHSSISGKVIKIEKRTIYGNETNCVIIQNDYKEDVELIKETENQLMLATANAGIVGMGGAGFPTEVKLIQEEHTPIKHLIVNAAECEPYGTADRRIIIEETRKLIAGIQLLKKHFGEVETSIAIESSSTEAVRILSSISKDLSVVLLPESYPQGAEKVIIESVMGEQVPAGKLPKDVGAVVINISTVYAIYQAMIEKKCLTERIVTVTGSPISEPKNIRVKIGTTIEHVIDNCGGFSQSPEKLINGGPMMGKLVRNLNEPVTKTTSLILALSAKELNTGDEQNCIRCSSCITTCPVNLQPVLISQAFRENNLALAEKLGALQCIDCGGCSYVCPSKIHLLADIKQAKKEIMGRKK